ncbi:MAG: hypothetical protein QOJ68_747 [Blastococcus sp.]|jgi:hypothetical protein|nr:hypothetical protein [Blastococcus sp.]
MAKKLGCFVGRHQWYIASRSGSGGGEADCWNCGKQRRKQAGPLHPSALDRHDAARARDAAFSARDAQRFYDGFGW